MRSIGPLPTSKFLMCLEIEEENVLKYWNCKAKMEGQTNRYEVHSLQLACGMPQQNFCNLP